MRLRALKMLDLKLRNYTNVEIAQEFRVHPKTVERTLSSLKRNGIILDAEDQLLSELLPKASKVLKDALDEGDVGVAIKVWDKVVKGRDAKKQEGTHDEDELTKYIREKRAEAELRDATIEGELATTEPKQLAAAFEQAGTPSDGLPVASEAPPTTSPGNDAPGADQSGDSDRDNRQT